MINNFFIDTMTQTAFKAVGFINETKLSYKNY